MNLELEARNFLKKKNFNGNKVIDFCCKKCGTIKTTELNWSFSKIYYEVGKSIHIKCSKCTFGSMDVVKVNNEPVGLYKKNFPFPNKREDFHRNSY